jgi:hypothetical protein
MGAPAKRLWPVGAHLFLLRRADTCHPADSGRFDALREGTSGNWKPLP